MSLSCVCYFLSFSVHIFLHCENFSVGTVDHCFVQLVTTLSDSVCLVQTFKLVYATEFSLFFCFNLMIFDPLMFVLNQMKDSLHHRNQKNVFFCLFCFFKKQVFHKGNRMECSF